MGELIIDRSRRRVTLGGEPIQLTPTEYRLVSALASRPDEILSRDDLATLVWGYQDASSGRTIDVHIRRLRVKLTQGPVPGAGDRGGARLRLQDGRRRRRRRRQRRSRVARDSVTKLALSRGGT